MKPRTSVVILSSLTFGVYVLFLVFGAEGPDVEPIRAVAYFAVGVVAIGLAAVYLSSRQ